MKVNVAEALARMEGWQQVQRSRWGGMWIMEGLESLGCFLRGWRDSIMFEVRK
jgi:hypothetical protein